MRLAYDDDSHHDDLTHLVLAPAPDQDATRYSGPYTQTAAG